MPEYMVVFDRITRMTQNIHAKDEAEAIKKLKDYAKTNLMGECEIIEVFDYQSLICQNCGSALKDGTCYNWNECKEAKYSINKR